MLSFSLFHVSVPDGARLHTSDNQLITTTRRHPYLVVLAPAATAGSPMPRSGHGMNSTFLCILTVSIDV